MLLFIALLSLLFVTHASKYKVQLVGNDNGTNTYLLILEGQQLEKRYMILIGN